MRASTFRAALALLVVVVPVGAAFAACSSSSSAPSSGPPSDASVVEGSAYDALPGVDATHDADAATPVDASHAGDADATSEAAADAGPDTAVEAAPDAYPDGSGFSGDCGVGPVGEPTDLRCAGLYSDWASKTVASDVQAYDPGLHLWSDGADKSRWIHLPPGQKIDTTDMNEWVFPVGTRVYKEFRLPLGDGGAPTRVETRLLWKQDATNWYRTTYRWTADGVSDATELTAGELDAGGTSYEVPSQDECRTCHSGRQDTLLGFEAVSLSSPGASGITMQTLTAQNLLTAPPAKPLTIPGNATESAALGYLHANCGTACHNRNSGAAVWTGFFMRLDVATLTSVQSTDAYTTGWNVPATVFSIPDAGTSYRIHACDLGSSCAYYRPSSRAFNEQMPPLDTHVVDDAGTSAIAAWITEGCDAGAD